MKRMRILLPVLFLVILPALVFWPLWRNPFSADQSDQIYQYSLRVQAGRAVRELQLPWTDVHANSGRPVLADPNAGTFHPTTLLFALFSPRLAYTLTILTGFVLAGVGMYLYLRRVGVGCLAALLGATVVQYGGFLAAHRAELSLFLTAGMIPWWLLCFEIMRGRARRAVPLLSLVIAVTILAGHWPMLLQMTPPLLVYGVLRCKPRPPALAALLVSATVAVLICSPQLSASWSFWRQDVARDTSYAAAGRGSYFPLSALTWVFPMLLGNRGDLLYAHSWWGAGPQAAGFGYAGLIVLLLATATAWSLFRYKPSRRRINLEYYVKPYAPSPFIPVVRTWVWLCLGMVLYALGYYLPTFRIVHAIPLLGSLGNPARAMWIVHLALATLAAVGVHAAQTDQHRADFILKALRRRGVRALGAIAIMTPLLLLAAAVILRYGFDLVMLPRPLSGTLQDVYRSLRPWRPSLGIPLLTMLLTILAVRYWTRNAARRSWVVLAVLLADLWLVVPFVDVAARCDVPPSELPAARWIRQAGGGESFRVWAPGASGHSRPVELLCPRVNSLHGVTSFNSVGPAVSPTEAHLLGFDASGQTPEWRSLLWRNHLLSLYRVRYLLVEAGSKQEAVLRAVRVPSEPSPAGENLLGEGWRLDNALHSKESLLLSTQFLVQPSRASQRVWLRQGVTYRLMLPIRAPFHRPGELTVSLCRPHGRPSTEPESWQRTIAGPRLGEGWRIFEFLLQPPGGGEWDLRLHTVSGSLIEVARSAWLRDDPPAPLVPMIQCGDRREPALTAGQRVYTLATTILPVRPGEPAIRIYENRLWNVMQVEERKSVAPAEVEALRWTLPARAWRPSLGYAPPSKTAMRNAMLLTMLGLCVLILSCGVYAPAKSSPALRLRDLR
jgi:hypothetical protein